MGEAFVKAFDSFGPIGFGVLALLVLWRFIVAPELAKSRADAKSILTAALILERVAIKLERMTEAEGASDERGH